MASLMLIRGLPGSGKSTLAKALLFADYADYCFEADDYFTVNGVYNFNEALLDFAHNACRRKTEDALSEGMNVIVANTFTTMSELTPYFTLAKQFNITPVVVLCQGQWESIHNVPAETIKKMKKRFEYDFSSLMKKE
jgi:predicted kinase